MKTKSDVLICRQLINCLGLRHGVCCHVIATWLFGPIGVRLTFCGHHHVSMSSLSIIDHSDRKMSMSPDLNTGVRDIKTEPIAAQLAIPPQSYLCFDPVPPRAFVNLHRLTFAKWSDKVGSVLGRRGARGTIQQRSSSGLRCLPEAIVSSPGMGGDGHCLTLSMQHFVCFIP